LTPLPRKHIETADRKAISSKGGETTYSQNLVKIDSKRRRKNMKAKNGATQTIIVFVLAVLTAIPFAGSVNAQTKSFEFKYASPYPQQEINNHAPALWADALDKRTGGRVKVTPYYSETLGKGPDMLHMLKTGICDVAMLNYPMFPGVFQVTDILSLPFFVPNRYIGEELIYTLYHRGLLEKEYSGFKLLWYQVNTPANFMLRNKKVTKMEDLKGLKIRVFPGTAIKTLKALGATTIAIPTTEVYTALERGTVDGLITMPDWFLSAKLHEVTKYYLWVPIAGGMHMLMMSQDKWNSLPPDIQAIMEELSGRAKYQFLGEADRRDSEMPIQIKATKVDSYSLSGSEVSRWQKATQGVVDEWVSEMEAKGLPGREAVKVAKQVLERFK
jgi:TRAP-type C4-dicarboxylate transport system substrate-binding protein